MRTYTGRIIDPMAIKEEDICIEDIAHHLSNICRFNGACAFHYSVAQHSVYVSKLCRSERMHGLLHDAAEAYLTDLPRPVKYSGGFEYYRSLETYVQAKIRKRFGLSDEVPATVKENDNKVLVTEGIRLMNVRYGFAEPADLVIEPMTPPEAKALFLSAYQFLISGYIFEGRT